MPLNRIKMHLYDDFFSPLEHQSEDTNLQNPELQYGFNKETNRLWDDLNSVNIFISAIKQCIC